MKKTILKRYHRFKTELNIQLFSFTLKDIDWKRKRITGGVFDNDQWKIQVFPFPDAVYNRCYRKKAKTLKHLERYIGKDRCFNHITYFNKWYVFKMLSNTNLSTYVPDTSLFNLETFTEWLAKGHRIIMKPCYGFQGQSVFLIELTEDLTYKIYEHTIDPIFLSKDTRLFYKKINQLIANKKFIIQKEIKLAKINGNVADLRILVQKSKHGIWELTNGISRIAYKGFYVTNFCEKIHDMDKILGELYPNSTKKQVKMKEIAKISIETAQILENQLGLLGEIGIDMAIDTKGQLWIIEVNGKMQKSMYQLLDKEADIDIDLVYKRPLEYATYLTKGLVI